MTTLFRKEYKGTAEFENEFEATEYARNLAIEEYESYEGLHGIPSREELAEENELNFEDNSQEIEDLYMEEMECWLEFSVIPTEEDETITSEEIYEL